MNLAYVGRRLGVFVLVIVVAVSINFFIPRLRSTNPIEARMNEYAAQGGGNAAASMKALIVVYNAKFGFDKPLWQQYLNYWSDLSRFDLGISVAFFPGSVKDEILRAAPWTIGLLAVSTLLAFTIGSVLGALLAWPNTSRLFSIFVPVLMTLSAIPYYLLGLLLIYLLALVWPVLPTAGAYTSGARLVLTWAIVGDIVRHAILPAGSIILAGIGFWGLGMRAMMVTIMGEELSLASIMSGALLVEIIFAYPGIGYLLYRGISGNDYFVIQGVTLFIIVGVAFALLLLDFIYPLLDPRIQLRRT